MEPLAVPSITMGSNFELAQIWLGDGKVMRFIDEYIFLILLCFLFLDLFGSRSTVCFNL